MLKQQIREKLQSIIENHNIRCVSIEDAKYSHIKGIHTNAFVHAHDGAALREVIDIISDIFSKGEFSSSREVKSENGDFVTTDFINDECNVTIFTSKEKLPAPTESNNETILHKLTTFDAVEEEPTYMCETDGYGS